jgi:hypothetical protein
MRNKPAQDLNFLEEYATYKSYRSKLEKGNLFNSQK